MKNYEETRDGLIYERNDAIDNAAYDVILAIVRDKSESDKQNAVRALCEELQSDNYDGHALLQPKNLMAKLQDTVKSFKPEEGEDGPAWDMCQIEQVTSVTESHMQEEGTPVCHPFFCTEEPDDGSDIEDDDNYDEDNGDVLCCLSCDRCGHCFLPEG